MKKLLTLITFKAFLLTTAFSQNKSWQQEVDYTINVQLNDSTHTLLGFVKIRYYNHSPDTLRFIWFHLWPNAFKNDRTAYSEQLLQNHDTRFYYASEAQKGYINQLDFRVNDRHAETADHPQHPDILLLLLPQALAPGENTLITTPFQVKIPFNFTGEGHNGQHYQLVQWHPKPAVYDQQGWHPMPYSFRGDNYGEPGNYTVSLSLPANYVVAASGQLQDDQEKIWLNSRTAFDWQPVKKRVRIKKGSYKTITQRFPTSDTSVKTLRFQLQDASNFAWAADKRWALHTDTITGTQQQPTIASYYYLPQQKKQTLQKIPAIEKALCFYDSAIFKYPFNELQVVPSTRGFAASNLLFLASRSSTASYNPLAYSVSTLWTEGRYAMNLRQHPWLRAGISNFFSRQLPEHRPVSDLPDRMLSAAIAVKKDQPADLAADQYAPYNYALSAGVKAGQWLQLLQDSIGDEKFQQVLRGFYARGAVKHPDVADFRQSLDSADVNHSDRWLQQLHGTGYLRKMSPAKMKASWSKQFFSNDSVRYIGLAPALGYNHYDKLMIGGMVHNFGPPAARLRFIVIPLYATGSKQLNGLAQTTYSWFPSGMFDKIETGISAAKFTADDFKDDDGHITRMHFIKLAPFIRFNFRHPIQSNRERYLQLKYFAIHEQNLRFSWDSVDMRTTYRKTGQQRGLLQLKWAELNDRALYPYHWDLTAESGQQFARLALTGNYFFNYGVYGGLNIRAFAGKFFYLGDRNGQKRADTYRYHLNMTAPKGEEDYTYSNYFGGRNEFEGFWSQQVMMRDGGFKVRTDLLSNKIGRTDNWLAAVNFTSVFHPQVPIKLFADFGTYAEGWETDADTPRLLFDAGIQVSLFKNILNVYVPLLYNKTYRDYFRSTPGNNFLQRISFSIDIQHVRLKNIHPLFSF